MNSIINSYGASNSLSAKSLSLSDYLSASSSTSSSSMSLIDVLNGSSSSDDSVSITDGLSSMSSLISSVESLGDEQKKELKAILKKAQEEMSGDDEYDSEELAETASSSLTAALKEQGLDLKDVLSSYETLYDASQGSGLSASSDYSSLLTAGSDSRLYSLVNTMLDRQLGDA